MYEFGVTLGTTAGPLPVLAGGFTFDRGWSPLGQGSFTVPLSAWEATGFDPLKRVHLIVHISHRNYSTTGTLAATLGPGALGTTAWPKASVSPFGTGALLANTISWHVWLRAVSVNRRDATASLEVATFETAMQETINNYGSWMPQEREQGGYDAADVMTELLKFVGLQAPLNSLTTTIIPAEAMSAWEVGQSVWDYWDHIRLLGELGYTLEPSTGIITIGPPQSVTGTIPAAVLAHEEEFGTAAEESATYADSLAVTWTWTEGTGEAATEYKQRDVAYAPWLSDWRDARRHVEVERIGKPVPGYAWRAVEQMSRFRRMHRVEVPLTPLLLASVPSPAYQSVDFTFGSAPTATLSILTN